MSPPIPPALPKAPFARHNLRTVVDFEFTRTMKKGGFCLATLSIPVVTPDIATAMGRKKATAPHRALQDVKAGVTGAYFANPAEPATQLVEVGGTDEGTSENGNFDAVAKQLLVVSTQAAVGSPQLTAAASRDVKTDSETFRDGQKTGGFGSAIPPLMFR